MPMLIMEIGEKYDVAMYPDCDLDSARKLARKAISTSGGCVAYALSLPAILTGNEFRGTIPAIAVEGAERGMSYAYRLFGIEDNGKIVPIYDGHSPQLFSESK